MNRALITFYRPIILAVLKAKTVTIIGALAALVVTIWPARQLGSEFMPFLNEGKLMYMPTTLPGLSLTKAAELIQTHDRIIKSFQEVLSVFGNAGRALTEMEKAAREVETVVCKIPGTTSAYAERVIGGYYLDITPNRAALGPYGPSVQYERKVIGMALGAKAITQTVAGQQRYDVAVLYPAALRSDSDAIAREVLVALSGGGTVPLGDVAKIERTRGANSIRTVTGMLSS